MTPPVDNGRTSAGRPKLAALQGMRCAAALLVVCDHSIGNLNSKVGADNDPGFAWFLGTLGVQIFFVISGLTMMLSHGSDFGIDGKPKKFLIRRLTRIAPMYWVTTIIHYAKLGIQHATPGLFALTLSILFIPHKEVGIRYGFPTYAVGWTLQYEMFFYLVFTVALCFRVRPAIIGMTVVFACLSSVSMSDAFKNLDGINYLGRPIVLFFIIGVFIGLAQRKLRSAHIIRASFVGAIQISGICIIIAITLAWLLGADSIISKSTSVIAAIITVAVCAFAREPHELTMWRRLAILGGDATYAIYLTHLFVIGPSSSVVRKFAPHLPPQVFVGLMVAICIPVGIVAYLYCDRPITKWLSNRIQSIVR